MDPPLIHRTALAFCLAASALVSAAPGVMEPDSAFAACRGVEDPGERLNCYDRAADQAASEPEPESLTGAPDPSAVVSTDEPAANASGETPGERVQPVTAAPAAQPDVSAEDLFGKSSESLAKTVEDVTGVKAVDSIAASVVSIGYTDRGRLVIRLDNEQVWMQIDGNRMPLRVGDDITIRRAALGSYALRKAGGNRSIKVRRR